MAQTILLTVSDDRSGRKGGQYGYTQARIANMLAGWIPQRHLTYEDFSNCDPLMKYADAARNGRVYKPWSIQQALNELEDGDFLIYNDCSPELWPQSVDLTKYDLDVIRTLSESNQGLLAAFVKWDTRKILPGELGQHVHELFTLDSCLEIMGGEPYRYSYLCASGMLCIQKSEFTMQIVDNWLHYNRIPECSCMNISEHEDSYWSLKAGRKLGNRHDQSVLSILLNQRNFEFCDIVYNDMSPYNFLNFCIPGHQYRFIPSNPGKPQYRSIEWISEPQIDYLTTGISPDSVSSLSKLAVDMETESSEP